MDRMKYERRNTYARPRTASTYNGRLVVKLSARVNEPTFSTSMDVIGTYEAVTVSDKWFNSHHFSGLEDMVPQHYVGQLLYPSDLNLSRTASAGVILSSRGGVESALPALDRFNRTSIKSSQFKIYHYRGTAIR
ncbi:hypothetical protein FRC03_004638 [Tulasnella sp. 419]|nr:hypothetical protein FRC03_004638 [Tulasnella sp. 419]